MGICLDTDASAAPDTEEGNESWHQQTENRNGSSANFSGQTITQPLRSVDIANVGKIKFDPPKVPVIFVLGGPGSGKVTHCDTFMQERRGITHINMMDLLQQYALGNDMQDFSQLSSKTVTEVLMLEMKMAPAAKAYLISGYPRSMRDVVEYSEKIQVVNGVILISWRQSILQKQIDYGAKLGHVVLSLARMELDNFFKNVMPVADYFDQSDMLIAVNGERAPSEVYKDFRAAVLDILSALENQEAMLNGITGMGRGIHDIPGSIVSVETAPSQPPPHIAEMPNITTISSNINDNYYNNNNNNNHNTETTNTPHGAILNNPHNYNNNVNNVDVEVVEQNEENLVDNPMLTGQPSVQSNRIPPIIWVIGGPGSNKATLCLRAVGLNLGWGHISVGRLLRAITDSAPRANTEDYAIKEALGAGEMAPEHSVNNILDINIRQLSDRAGIIIDGYPRDLEQVKYFENKYKQFPPIILLDCSKLQLGRGRIDDSVSSFRRRLEVFRELTLPMLKTMDNSKRLQIVDGDTDSPSVQREFEKIIRSHIQRLQNGYANGISVTDHYAASADHTTNHSEDGILEDLENNDNVGIKTISHHVSLTNGHLKNRNNSGNNNFNNRVQPYNNNKPMLNGDITGENINFRHMLQEAERYPVDSYI